MFDEVVSVEVVRHFCHIAGRRLGVGIDSKVEALIAGRVAKRLKVLQVPLDEYLARLDSDETCEEVVGFLDVMRPRASHFFARWSEHAQLHAHLRRWLAAGRRRFRVWTAGCGTGEEAFAMALTFRNAIEAAGLSDANVDWKILASDLSPRTLERGRQGQFDEQQLVGLPEAMRERYFRESGEGAEIADEIKAHVLFRRLNLAQPPFPMTGPLDAIFCHEGLAPLLPKARRRALEAAKSILADGGLLCTGYDEETLQSMDNPEDDLWNEGLLASTPRSPGHC